MEGYIKELRKAIRYVCQFLQALRGLRSIGPYREPKKHMFYVRIVIFICLFIEESDLI